MRIAALFGVLLTLCRLGSADTFTYILNPSTETATVTDTNVSCTLIAGCSGGAIQFGCGGIAPPIICSLQYNRVEYYTDLAAGCDPSNLSLPRCPNDMTPLFPIAAVIDGAGSIEGVFNFISASHSLVFDSLAFDPAILPRPITDYAQGLIRAYIVDNGSGQPQFLDTMFWTNGEVDTFSFQFVPEPSSIKLLFGVILLCGLTAKRSSVCKGIAAFSFSRLLRWLRPLCVE